MRLALLAVSIAAFSTETPLRILFLGNSYTYYNNLPGLVEGMARASGGRPVETGFVTLGGATLEGLYTGTNALEVLRGSQWDLVVLQEHSTLGLNQFNGDFVVNEPAAFFTWARIWDLEIRAQGARTVFLNTWARKGRPEQQPHLDWAYSAIAKELGAGLIPAGTAFQDVAGTELYQPDGTHPSPAGSYLAACAAVEILAAHGCLGAPAEVLGMPMDNGTARLHKEPGAIVMLPRATAALLQASAIAAVVRLRAESGYWRLARPVFAGDPLPEKRKAPVALAGRWEGTTWLYGQPVDVDMQVSVEGQVCNGTWKITALKALTHATLPLMNCSAAADSLRFVVRPLFLGVEMHEGWWDGKTLQGTVSLQTMTPYVRRNGTWTLQRVKP